MIKNIIFDMGNVLMDYNPKLALDAFLQTPEDKALIKRELFEGPEWIQGDMGSITDADKFEGVSKRVPPRLHEALRKCVDGWSVYMAVKPEAQEFTAYVKEKGYRIYVLSNASDAFYQYFPQFAALDYFDGIVVSSDVHLIKPDIKIYRYFLEKYGLKAEECLFIDDREENVSGAGAAGMHGHVFREDFEALRELV